MAAPTDVDAEGTSITTIQVWWTYSGGNAIGIYTSTDGVIFALAATAAIAAVTYELVGLATATKYWIKVTDDLGGTFSSTVTTHTHTCLRGQGDLQGFTLPRFDGSEQQSSDLNNMAERIEVMLGGKVLAPGTCVACPEDGALIIDCLASCDNWVVIADEDVDSITINNCDERPVNIEFLVGPNVTRRICGWPAGFGFGGDECRRTPFVTGATGGSISAGTSSGSSNASPAKSAGKNSYSGGISKGVGGGSGCTCTPRNGALTIKSCNSNNSLNCSSTKSLKLIACGGKEPYTWSNTGSVTLSRTSDTSVIVTPPANTGSAVAGIAYVKHGGICAGGGGAPEACPDVNFGVYASNFGCNDAASSSCGQVTLQPGDGGSCVGAAQNLGANGCAAIVSCFDGGACSYGTCDARSAAMIAAGCNPCGVQAGATVSVTDALGVVYTLVLGS